MINKIEASNRKGVQVISILFLTVGALLLSFFPFRSWVSAQLAGQSLQISPPSQEAKASPGETITLTAKVRNQSNATLPINVSIQDFTAVGDEGQIALETGSKWSVTGWAKLSPQKFDLASGDEQEVTATIKIPKDVAGGRYGSFVFSVQPKSEKNAAAVSQEIASIFLLRISGKVNESLTLTKLSAPSFAEFGPIPLSMTFHNSGNVYVKTLGLINVTDMFGNKVADIPIKGTNIFPEADRVVHSMLDNRFLVGKFKATAIMYYGNQNQVINETTSFIVFPTRIAFIILALLITLFLMRKRLKKATKALFR